MKGARERRRARIFFMGFTFDRGKVWRGERPPGKKKLSPVM